MPEQRASLRGKSEARLTTCPTCRGDGKVPNPDAPCRCGHRYAEHHYNSASGGGCCVKVDRFALCRCARFKFSSAPTSGCGGRLWIQRTKPRVSGYDSWHYQAMCTCGWTGPERGASTVNVENDVGQHRFHMRAQFNERAPYRRPRKAATHAA